MLAPVAPSIAAYVVRFEVTRVNQERETVRPGGTVPLCQAIPPIDLGVHLRWRLVRPVSARVTVRYAGATTRVHRVRLARGSAARTLRLFPRDERLAGERFAVGRVEVRVVAAGRTTRAQMRFSGGTTC